VPVQQDLPSVGLHAGGHVVLQLGLLQHPDPAPRPVGPRHPVDHHRLGEHQVTAEVGGGSGDGQAGRAQPAGGTPVTGQPGRQRHALQPEGRRVEHPVKQGDPAVLVITNGPVDHAGGRGRDRGREAGRGEQARRVEAALRSRVAAGEVQEHGAGPEADGQVAEGRVQRVTEPPAAVHQLEDRVVLVLLAPRRQHGGQLVVQRAYPAPAVDQRDQIVMPVLHPGQHGGRPGEPGGLGGWCRAFGLAGVCCHEVLRADGRNRCAERTLSSPMSPFHAETPLEAAGPAGAGVKG